MRTEAMNQEVRNKKKHVYRRCGGCGLSKPVSYGTTDCPECRRSWKPCPVCRSKCPQDGRPCPGCVRQIAYQPSLSEAEKIEARIRVAAELVRRAVAERRRGVSWREVLA